MQLPDCQARTASHLRTGGRGTSLPPASNHPGTTDTLLSSALKIMLEDERRIRPGTTGTDPLQWKETECLECTGLACFNEQGNQIPDFHPALLHELYSDGAFFTTAMFHGETSSPPAIRNFQLVQTLHPDAFDAVCGACAKASGNTDFSSPNTGDNFSALGLNLNDSGISGEAANTNISRCGGGRNTPERSVSGIPDTAHHFLSGRSRTGALFPARRTAQILLAAAFAGPGNELPRCKHIRVSEISPAARSLRSWSAQD